MKLRKSPANIVKKLRFPDGFRENTEKLPSFRSETGKIFKETLSLRTSECRNCEDLQETLRNLKKIHAKEVQHLSFLINFKDLALKKRDCMVYEYNRENLQLKARVKELEGMVKRVCSRETETLSENGDDFFEKSQFSRENKRKVTHIKPFSQSQASFSHISLTNKDSINSSPHRSPSKRLSRRLSNFIVNSISLFTTKESQGMLNILMEEGEDPILNHPKILELEEFLRSNANYLENFSKMNMNSQNEVFSTVNTLFSEFKNNVNLIGRLTKLIKSCQILSTSLVLEEALELMVRETCENLCCDRASVFILDSEKGELWSKVAKGTKTIRIPINRGIAGYVAVNNANIRIDNAYSDPRFNREIDKQTNYYTKTILSVPIKDLNGEVAGVIEAINKNNGFFTADDEGLLTILANQAGLILRNSMRYDKLVLNQYKLMKLINIGMSLFQCISLEMVMISAEQKLCELANSEKCYIYLYDCEKSQLIRYDTDKTVKICESSLGIIGECLKTGAPISTARPDFDPLFNKIVDLDTHLSLLTIPVKSAELEKIIAVFQFIDVHASISKHLGKTNNFELEILSFFIKIFAICIENACNIKKQMESFKEAEENRKKMMKRFSEI